MSNQPLVSVIIATYNMGEYVADAVRSVLAQTWQNIEVIVIDDGSTDGTAARLSEFKGNSRVRVVVTANRGQPKAKNLGITEAKGEFLAFCDADDVWSPDKLELQMPKFSDPKVGVVYSDVAFMDGHDQPLFYRRSHTAGHTGFITDHLVIRNSIPFGTAVIRRECVEWDGSFDESLPMGIDWDLWLRYSINWKFEFCPEQTYTYRIWPGQMSKNYRGRYENGFRILDKFLKNNPNRITRTLKARARADMYISRGMAIASAEKSFSEPFSDIMKAIKHDASYTRGWRSLVKLLVRRV
ncbi:glycosyltransferase family 2 protein [Marinobacter sp. X15-166B]|uniref:glycosyltransferase family 2 protein n=1 Tax=Marinobacter sp. X15-166B TaxID=1897620 RepID=UPI00085BBC97|nr:glycosyltransferase [Marinobacter sp. X15-166B]OEY67750.1 hypothetical protein BG841_15815 [Marinobacter sp. X15-166B]